MRKLAAILVLLLGSLALLGSGSYKGGSYGKAGQTYQAGGVARDGDTFKVRSRTVTYPNSAAILAGYSVDDSTYYDYDNKADNGTTVRWGWVKRSAPNTVQCSANANQDFDVNARYLGNSTEDNFTMPASQNYIFLWFSANGLKRGQRVENAYIVFNAHTFGVTVASGRYISANLDTIAKDYRILNNTSANGTHGANNDVARFDASWNYLDTQNSVAWDPPLDERLDYHDFGPRANSVIGPGTYPAATSWRLDVTDAIQQALDNPRFDLSKGFLFLVRGTGTATDFGALAGNYPLQHTIGKGNPLFTATVTSRRGPKPWGMTGTPIAMIWDGEWPSQTDYYSAMRDSGLVMNTSIVAYNMDGTSQSYDWPDSVLALHPGSLGLLHLSKTILSLGPLTGSQRDNELTRSWFPAVFPNSLTAADTSAIVDKAWIGGTGSPYRSLKSASRAMAFGYRSIRAGGYEWTATETAVPHDTRMAWTAPFNRVIIWGTTMENIFESGSSLATDAEILERLTDYVDDYYSRYGRAALVLYGHSPPNDRLTGAALRSFIGLTRRLNSCEIVEYGNLVNRRLSGATFLTPAQVEVMRGITADSNMIQAMAAQQDSAYAVDNDPNYLQMWVAPK